jgi:phosphonate transport system substrate-binding protein
MIRRAKSLSLALGLALLGALPLVHATETPGITLGIIAAGATVEQTLEIWKPLTDALSKELQTPVRAVASKNYADISSGIKEGKIQVAWINNKLAVDLVETEQAQIFAQMVRLDKTRGYKSVLIVPKNSPINAVADALGQPGVYTLGLGAKNSTSGYLVPYYYVFQKAKIDPAKHFKSVTHGTHRENFLAVAEGRADMGTNNTEDLPRFQAELPDKFAQIKVIWESPLIPNDPLVYRKDLPAATQQRIKKFFIAYGKTEAEKATLKSINGLSGFVASSNHQLRPIVDLELFDALTKAMAGSNANGTASFNGVVDQLTKRAARLDTMLNATRFDAN